jgi:hypothetical protein
MQPYEKIYNYTVIIRPETKTYILKLKISNQEFPVEHIFSSVLELAAIAELLRDENYTYYDNHKKEIIIGWEPTGENDPKHTKTF